MIIAKVIQMILIKLDVRYLSNFTACPNLLFEALFIFFYSLSSSSSENTLVFVGSLNCVIFLTKGKAFP